MPEGRRKQHLTAVCHSAPPAGGALAAPAEAGAWAGEASSAWHGWSGLGAHCRESHSEEEWVDGTARPPALGSRLAGLGLPASRGPGCCRAPGCWLWAPGVRWINSQAPWVLAREACDGPDLMRPRWPGACSYAPCWFIRLLAHSAAAQTLCQQRPGKGGVGAETPGAYCPHRLVGSSAPSPTPMPTPPLTGRDSICPCAWRGKAGPSTLFGTCILCGGLGLKGFSEVS